MKTQFSLLRYLSEAQVRPFDSPETGSIAELAEIIKTKCSAAAESFLNNRTTIFRGWSDDVPDGVYDSSTGKRKSENTSNWYTKFMDSNPDNEGFPPRQRSFICTDSEFVAEEYAAERTTLVFPFNGVKLGVLASSDIWDIAVKTGSGEFIQLSDLNEVISSIVNTFGDGLDTMEDLIGLIETLSPADLEALEGTKFDRLHIDQVPAQNRMRFLVDLFTQAYSFPENGAKVVSSVADVKSVGGTKAHELWFSGKCVLIDIEHEEELRQLLK